MGKRTRSSVVFKTFKMYFVLPSTVGSKTKIPRLPRAQNAVAQLNLLPIGISLIRLPGAKERFGVGQTQ